MSSHLPASKILQLECEKTWQWRIDTDPELAASLGLLPNRRSKHTLDPRSLQSFNDRLNWIKEALSRIQTHIPDVIMLDEEDEKLCYILYTKQLSEYIENFGFKAFLMCINRMEGPQVDLPLYARYLPTKTKSDCMFYKGFLEAIPTQLEEVTELLRHGIEEKRTPPKVSMEGVALMIRKVFETNGEAFTKPLDQFPGEFEDISNDCRDIIRKEVCPAFQALANFVETEYIPHLRDEISAVKGYPDGEAYYTACLNFHTTTDMSASEIHQMGLDEVARIKNDMKMIAFEAGYDDLEGYLAYLRTAEEFTPKSAEGLCASFRDISGRIYPELLNLFHCETLPRTPLRITETPSAQASTAPAAYYLAGANDGSRPGIFYVNTSELSSRRTYESEALALHEGIPGHHLQGAIQGENKSLADFRRFAEDRRYFEAPSRFPFYTGYIEGWGLHCETLGGELGLYKSASSRFGQLSMEALRACRLVVDTGMHAFGWSRTQALEYMLQNTAMGKHDASCEVTRYITWPGQACAYKVGERKISGLRKRAELDIPKGSLDIRDFYNVILLCGPVPLDVLEEMVDEFISANRSVKLNSTNEDNSLIDSMTFANWCKCCVVPGTCNL
mmetsp:Transcript_18328/g.28602  ORF Transcript_18328/g.28602 Transcript_18328/m.28602 type:complete len:616 (-) Transcript_18328:66-1913(-)|eukprot:CAMPEP_0196808010 /NCGR_PEP_ID=MMETSP1362-20130617/7973_1 /TAXON_ID=163516 /ORGANISM="Leptocylindrus danicus, Strain CCMP1856" /LENGTH=615 /DNA_ID=CAMNT_0042182147 /DNA_START=43 /DNA_END=1890 /DNA_ORIENTATION=+